MDLNPVTLLNNNNISLNKKAGDAPPKPRPVLRRLPTLQDMVKEVIYEKPEVSDHDGIPAFVNYPDLACETVGGKIIFATDDWFAAAENMLKFEEAVFKDELFTDYGKWMDGWETRRKRTPGHDWCIIELGCPGKIDGIEVSTHHFTGNFPPKCSIQGASLTKKLPGRKGDRIGHAAKEEEIEAISLLNSQNWETLVPQSDLNPGYSETHRTFFDVCSNTRITHIRLNIFPDGGIARIRVHGEVKPDWSRVSVHDRLDLVAMVNGGVCVDYSDAHYGHARNVIAPGRARKMNEGWETARRLDRPAVVTSSVLENIGGEWAIYKLGHAGVVEAVEIDTNHFKGNYPHSFTLEGAYIESVSDELMTTGFQLERAEWRSLVPRYQLYSHEQQVFDGESVKPIGKINHVRLTILPDGGISRMILTGRIVRDENGK